MIQACTILLDSLRMLRASKLFWVSIWISTMVALVYASIGFTNNGISAGFGLWEIPMPILRKGTKEAEVFYMLMFTDVIVRFWLGWFSLVLALISTSSIFPQFLQTGSIEIALSKPVSRTRLFLLKYLGGLLFVALQTALFCFVAFIAIGLRVNEWNITIFWAVPVITFSFSLVYCVGVIIGVSTRSTVYALLGALMFWVLTLVAQWTEDFMYKVAYIMPEVGMGLDLQSGQIGEADNNAGSGIKKAYEAIKPVMAVLPKTRECTVGLKRLIHFKERNSILSGIDMGSILMGGDANPEIRKAMEKYEMRHSWFSIIGSSLFFEALVIGWALWIFSRRDY